MIDEVPESLQPVNGHNVKIYEYTESDDSYSQWKAWGSRCVCGWSAYKPFSKESAIKRAEEHLESSKNGTHESKAGWDGRKTFNAMICDHGFQTLEIGRHWFHISYGELRELCDVDYGAGYDTKRPEPKTYYLDSDTGRY